MADSKFTATQIGEIICDAWKLHPVERDNLQHKVRYIAKKQYLRHGSKADARGTLKFPKSEIYRAALFCEFLDADVDIRKVSEAVNQAETYRPLKNPESARAKSGGGFNYPGGLATAVRGVAFGESWRLLLTRMRSSLADARGTYGRYVWSGEEEAESDTAALAVLYGKPHAALIQSIDLNAAFHDIVKKVGTL